MTQISAYNNTLKNTKVVEINEVDCLIKNDVTIAKVGDLFVDINRNVLKLTSINLHYMNFDKGNNYKSDVIQFQTIHFLENELGLTSFEPLKKLILENTTFKIDVQDMGDYVQVAIWCKSFGADWSICFQDGDMNGNHKGEAVWTNEGADSGIDEFRDILIARPEFQCLIDKTTYWKYEALNSFIYEFINDYVNETSPEKFFVSENED